MFFLFLCPAPSIGDVVGNKRADCLSPLTGGRVSACSGPINRAMPQASCCQARRQAKRGAEQSPDCEHPSKPMTHRNSKTDEECRAGGQHRMAARGAASSHGSATRRAKRDRGVFFCFVFCHVAENEELISEKYPGSVEPLWAIHQRRKV